MGTAADEVGTEADVASGDAGTAAGEAGADADGLVEGDIGTAGWISSVSVDEEDAFLAATSRLCLSLSSMNILCLSLVSKLTRPLIIQSPFEESE